MQSRIEYTHLAGEGPTVVLIHGIGHRREAWGRVPEILRARGYDVYAVDLPGHGLSPKVARPDTYSMVSTAEQFERLLAELGLDHPHVVGNSLGGAVALELAHNGSVGSATVVSPAGFFPVHHLPNIGINLLFMKFGSHMPTFFHRRMARHQWFRRMAFRSLYTHPETVTVDDAVGDTLNLRRSKGFWPHFFRATFMSFRKDVTVPTTVAWGDSDRLLLPSEAHTARKRLPGASHVTLPDSGHCAQHDHPELVVDVVVSTIERSALERPAAQPQSVEQAAS